MEQEKSSSKNGEKHSESGNSQSNLPSVQQNSNQLNRKSQYIDKASEKMTKNKRNRKNKNNDSLDDSEKIHDNTEEKLSHSKRSKKKKNMTKSSTKGELDINNKGKCSNCLKLSSNNKNCDDFNCSNYKNFTEKPVKNNENNLLIESKKNERIEGINSLKQLQDQIELKNKEKLLENVKNINININNNNSTTVSANPNFNPLNPLSFMGANFPFQQHYYPIDPGFFLKSIDLSKAEKDFKEKFPTEKFDPHQFMQNMSSLIMSNNIQFQSMMNPSNVGLRPNINAGIFQQPGLFNNFDQEKLKQAIINQNQLNFQANQNKIINSDLKNSFNFQSQTKTDNLGTNKLENKLIDDQKKNDNTNIFNSINEEEKKKVNQNLTHNQINTGTNFFNQNQINPNFPPISTLNPLLNNINQITNMYRQQNLLNYPRFNLNMNSINNTSNPNPQTQQSPFLNAYPTINPVLNNLQLQMLLTNMLQNPQANSNSTQALQNLFLSYSKNKQQLNPIFMNQIKNLQNSQIQKSSAEPQVLNQNCSKIEPETNLNPQILYPIEDKELLKDLSLHGLTLSQIKKPEPNNTLVPPNLLGKVLKIWDFLITFRKYLLISQFTPEELYFSLIYKDDKEINLVNEIHISLLSIFLHYINKLETQELAQCKDTLLIKISLETRSVRHILKNSWVEVLRVLLNARKFPFFMSNSIEMIAVKLMNLNHSTYNTLQFEEKVELIEFLINSIYDVCLIKDVVKQEFDKRNELKREKSCLNFEYKTRESKKKEYEKQGKLAKSKSRIEAIQPLLDTIEKNLNEKLITKQEAIKQRKELENEREKCENIIKEISEFDAFKTKVLSRIDEIKKTFNSMEFTNIKLLGIDCFKNSYYFFRNYNSKIFVRRGDNWFSYNTKEEISELLNKLTDKSIKEKNLIINIKKVFPKKMSFKRVKDANPVKHNIDDTVSSNEFDYEQDEEDVICAISQWKNSDSESVNNEESKLPLQEIFNCVWKIEEKYTEYLKQFEKEWDLAINREKVKNYIKNSEDYSELSKAILFLIERFKNPYKINEFKDEDIVLEDYTYDCFGEGGKIEIEKVDEMRFLAPKIKLFSKEYDQYDTESVFITYIQKSIHSYEQIHFAIAIFEGIMTNFLRRRESTNKKIIKENQNLKEVSKEINNEQEKNEALKENVVTKSTKTNENLDLKNDERNDLEIILEDEDMKDDTIQEDHEKSFKTNNKKQSQRLKVKPKRSMREDSEEKIEKEKKSKAIEKSPIHKTKRGRKKTHIISSEKKDIKENDLINDQIDSQNHEEKNNNNISNQIDSSDTKKEMRKARIKSQTQTNKWKITCYICNDVGSLICCEGCDRVVHLFCACLDKEPDIWYCERCEKRNFKKSINQLK